MNLAKLKEPFSIFFSKDEEENNAEELVGRESMHRTLIFAATIVVMGLFYVYNDVDYDLQIKHYNKTREVLIDRRYIYISDQKELNEAGMRSNVNDSLSKRGSSVRYPMKKQVVIRDAEE